MHAGDFLDVLAAFETSAVPYVLTGGAAVVLHGISRDIEDLDIIVRPDPDECLRISTVLQSLGFFPTVLLPLHQVVVMTFLDQSWRRVDVHVRHLLPYDELRGRCRLIRYAGIDVPVIAVADLIEVKRMNRPEDPDLAALEAIR